VKNSAVVPSLAAGAGILVSVLVAGGVAAIGVEGEWVWRRVMPVAWLAAVPTVGLGLALAGGVAALCARRPRVAATLCLLAVGGFVLQAAVGYVSVLPVSGEAAIVTIAPYVGGYFHQATRVTDTWEFVRGYGEWMRGINLADRVLGHLGDHPPGLVLFYVAQLRLMEAAPWAARSVNSVASAVVPGGGDVAHAVAGTDLTEAQLAAVWLSGWLLRLLMALTVIPFYAVAKRICEQEAALKCAVIFSFVPAMHLFSPSPDQLFVLSSVLMAYLVVKEWQEREVWPGALAGVLMFVALNLTVGLVVLVVLGVIAGALSGFARVRAGEGRAALSARICGTVGAGAGAFLICLAACGVAGYSAVEVWLIALRKHAEFGGLFERTYWKWVLMNPLEFWAFLGVPAGAMVLWRVALGVSRARVKSLGLDVPLLSIVILLLLLNLSGKNPGEVARLWMFLMPFVVLGGCKALEQVEMKMVAAMAGSQVIQIVAFKLALDIFSIRMLGGLMPG